MKWLLLAITSLALFSGTNVFADTGSFVLEGDTVDYSFNGGTIVSSQIDTDLFVMTLEIDAPADGDLEITIPRTLLDAKFAGEDDEYFVIIDDFDVDYTETANTDQYRTLFIPILEGDTLIDIMGTSSGDSAIAPVEPEISIPEWIRTNAGWWADGSIDDGTFVNGIQYLIKEDILKIPPTTQGEGSDSNEIPSWIKNNAGWWADGSIDDGTFVNGIQYLITNGIIKV
jgi:hypothetical protein